MVGVSRRGIGLALAVSVAVDRAGGGPRDAGGPAAAIDVDEKHSPNSDLLGEVAKS